MRPPRRRRDRLSAPDRGRGLSVSLGSTAATAGSAPDSATPSAHSLPARLSPTAVDRYRTCPRQFLFADIERLPRADAASPAIVVGSAVHAALDALHGLRPEQRTGENAARALRARWVACRKPGSFASREEEVAHGRSALAMLHRYCEGFDLSISPLARERWVSVRLGGLELFGKVDRIDAGRDGGIDLVDYKTGRFVLDERDLPGEPAVQIYTLGAEATLKRPVERIRFIYLAHGTEVCWEPERDDVEALAERLQQTLAALIADQAFEPRPGDACRLCPYLCDARGRVELDQLVVDPGEVPF